MYQRDALSNHPSCKRVASWPNYDHHSDLLCSTFITQSDFAALSLN